MVPYRTPFYAAAPRAAPARLAQLRPNEHYSETVKLIENMAVIGASAAGGVLTFMEINRHDSPVELGLKVLLGTGLLVLSGTVVLFGFRLD